MIYINRQTNGRIVEATKENYPRLFEDKYGNLRTKNIDIVRVGEDIDIQTISDNVQYVIFNINEFLQGEKNAKGL